MNNDKPFVIMKESTYDNLFTNEKKGQTMYLLKEVLADDAPVKRIVTISKDVIIKYRESTTGALIKATRLKIGEIVMLPVITPTVEDALFNNNYGFFMALMDEFGNKIELDGEKALTDKTYYVKRKKVLAPKQANIAVTITKQTMQPTFKIESDARINLYETLDGSVKIRPVCQHNVNGNIVETTVSFTVHNANGTIYELKSGETMIFGPSMTLYNKDENDLVIGQIEIKIVLFSTIQPSGD